MKEGTQNPSCDHIGVVTDNADRLIEFYGGNFGFEKTFEENLPQDVAEKLIGVAVPVRFIKLEKGEVGFGEIRRLNGVVVEIFEPERNVEKNNGTVRTGYHHWGFRVGDREKIIAELKKNNIPVTEITRANGHKVYFIKDPDGNMVEIRDLY